MHGRDIACETQVKQLYFETFFQKEVILTKENRGKR
jgi:hypothetical protein